MMLRAVACWLTIVLYCARGYADARPVVVLLPNDLGSEAWPEGSQAVVAELLANGFQVVQQRSRAVTAGELLAEVAHSTAPQAVLGVVAVLREGDTGAAYVWTEHGERVLRDEPSGNHWAVAQGAVALRVVELFRTETLDFPISVSAPAQPRKARAERASHDTPSPDRLGAWIGVSTDAPTSSATLPLQASIGATAALAMPVALDLGARVGLLRSRVETNAGQFSLNSVEVGGRVMAVLATHRHVSFAIGVGVSSLWLRESATAGAGFLGKDDSTAVALLVTRARLILRRERLFGVVILDPGLAVPAISVRSNGGEVAHLGRPWLATELGVGWSF
jgi:hypothetical protein